MTSTRGMNVDFLCMAHMLVLVDDLDLDARSQWAGKGTTNQRTMLSATKQALSITFATTADRFVRDFDSVDGYMA